LFIISERSYKDTAWRTICWDNIFGLLFQIGRKKLLLGVLFAGLVVGAVFRGNFIAYSDALGYCYFYTSRNDTMTRAEEEAQCATYKGSSVGCIVFFILAFYIMLRNCDDSKIQNEKKIQ
jgi:hypothetical protein